MVSAVGGLDLSGRLVMKIALGTVQFGLEYGAFNSAGQIGEDQAGLILDRALAANVDTLDTARAYGDSEEVLGRLGAAQRFRIITKSPPLGDAVNAADALMRAVDQSCNALGTDHLDGYLLHRAEDLAGAQGDGLWRVLGDLKRDGQIGKIGVSGYDPAGVRHLLERYPLDLVQLPGNVLDPWFDEGDLGHKVEVHSRSAFLQGFLLSDAGALSPFHARWRDVLAGFQARAAARGLTPLQAALAPLLGSAAIDRVVLGVDGVSQFQDILEALPVAEHEPLGAFEIEDKRLLDPRQWPARGQEENP